LQGRHGSMGGHMTDEVRICPIMSRPDPRTEGKYVARLTEVHCLRERCALWQRNSEVPHCGLLG
jgi:hypothetical protein